MTSREMPKAPRAKAEILAELIEQRIDSGELVPGNRLGRKVDVAAEHKVSTGTLNEALRLLRARGYIELRPGAGGGAFVSPPEHRLRLRHSLLEVRGDESAIAECIQIRNHLEEIVDIEAARACTAEDAVRLEAALAEVVGVADPKARLIAVWRLHSEIAITGANRTLSDLYVGLLERIQSSIASVTGRDNPLPGVNADSEAIHERLVKAITNNDIEAVKVAVREHAP